MNVTRAALLFPAVLPFSGSKPDTPALRLLTVGLARGDDSAWDQFHRDYGPLLYRQLLAATCANHALASDALQQTYLRIARHARPCDSEPMFIAWLRTVARTALSDCRRREHSFWRLRQRRHADPSDDAARTDGLNEEQLQAALDTALAQLEADTRALLEAKYLRGLGVRELAEQLSLSPKAVESRLTRARAELRTKLLASLPRHE